MDSDLAYDGPGGATELQVPARASRELLAEQSAILARAAQGQPLPGLLEDLCRMIEDPAAGTTCTVLLVDGPVLRHGAAPGMPSDFNSAIDGLSWGPDRGSCGTSVYTGRSTLVDDIATDPRWTPWRDLALALGLRACWSVPVLGREGRVLATFAAYARTPRMPTPDERELLEFGAHLVSILLEQDMNRRSVDTVTRRLEETVAALQAANRTKDDFLSMTSHELRTPLTPMIGMLETLRARWHALEDRQRLDFLEVVERQATRLHHLVDDLLTMSAANAGGIRAYPDVVGVREAVETAVQAVGAADADVHVFVDKGLEIDADPTHVHQILCNYLTNAQKYAPDSPIVIRASRHGDRVEIRVVDSGPGIDHDLADQLFEPFTQADHGDRRTASGTGLGLAIVRRLAHVNDGDAWHERAPTGGATFTVSLPAAGREVS